MPKYHVDAHGNLDALVGFAKIIEIEADSKEEAERLVRDGCGREISYNINYDSPQICGLSSEEIGEATLIKEEPDAD